MQITISDPTALVQIYNNAVGGWVGRIGSLAGELFACLAGLELAIFGFQLWMQYNGSIERAILLTARKLLIIASFATLMLNAATWLPLITGMFVQAGQIAGGSGLNPNSILMNGLSISGSLLANAMQLGVMLNLPLAIGLLIAAVCIMAAFTIIALQFTFLLIQNTLVVALGLFMTGFGGSSWTVPYVEAVFRYAISVGVRLMTLYLLISIAQPLVANWEALAAQGQTFANLAGLQTAWAIAASAVIYAGIVHFSSHLVGQVFGASPSLSHSEAIAITSALSGAVIGAATAGSGGVGAAAGRASGAAGGGVSVPSGGMPASGPAPSHVSPNGAGVMVGAGIRAAQSMPHGGHAGSAPSFNGFSH